MNPPKTVGTSALKQRSANLNIRIPEGQRAMLGHIAGQLGLTLNSVVAILISWQLAAAEDQELWARSVAELREVTSQEPGSGMLLYDFDDTEWSSRLGNYEAMYKIGLIEGLMYRRSTSGARRWLCSFQLTQTGRVVSSVLSHRAKAIPGPEAGATD